MTHFELVAQSPRRRHLGVVVGCRELAALATVAASVAVAVKSTTTACFIGYTSPGGPRLAPNVQVVERARITRGSLGASDSPLRVSGLGVSVAIASSTILALAGSVGRSRRRARVLAARSRAAIGPFAGGHKHRSSTVVERGVAAVRPASSVAIETFMVSGPVDASKLARHCAALASYFDLSCLAFFSFGVSEDIIASVAAGALGIHGVCPVFIANSFGIIGWDASIRANVQLMEQGSGVVVVAFRGDAFVPSSGSVGADAVDLFVADRSAHMVVTAAGVEQLPAAMGVVHGGVAKGCWRLDHSGDLVAVPYFAVSSCSAVITRFTCEAGEAAAAAADVFPETAGPPLAASYFPSVRREISKCDVDVADCASIAAVPSLAAVRLFGMFVRDELGPPVGGRPTLCTPEVGALIAATSEAGNQSGASVLALYGRQG